jgi:non-canonical (house-cleaning) NTP pyrophosphatase
MALEIPASVVATIQERGFNNTTVGKIMKEHGEVLHHQDPHNELTHGFFPRQKLLSLAVELALTQLFSHITNPASV